MKQETIKKIGTIASVISATATILCFIIPSTVKIGNNNK